MLPSDSLFVEGKMSYDDEGNTRLLGSWVMSIRATPLRVDGCFNGKRDGHSDSTPDERWLPSDAVKDECNEETGHNNTQSTVYTSDHEDVRTAKSQGGIDLTMVSATDA